LSLLSRVKVCDIFQVEQLDICFIEIAFLDAFIIAFIFGLKLEYAFPPLSPLLPLLLLVIIRLLLLIVPLFFPLKRLVLFVREGAPEQFKIADPLFPILIIHLPFFFRAQNIVGQRNVLKQ
jgi:hypothetical protein